jgi:mevalonate kinase
MSLEKNFKRLQKTKASAPGKVILFGEHAVVYDKLGIAASVDLNCFVDVRASDSDKVTYEIKGAGMKKAMTKQELFDLYETVEKFRREEKFDEIKELQKKEKLSAALFVISSLMKKYGFVPIDVVGYSDVPKNLGSSSSAFSATAMAVSKFLGKDLSKEEICNLAYSGDVVAHGGTPSGIDNSIVTYGGYIQYRRSKGIKPLDIEFKLPIIFVDSGQPSKTGETVPYIREQRNENRDFADNVLDSLDKISVRALDALNDRKLELIGKLMVEYYSELKKLNISTEKLDEIVEIAGKNQALGAKPTGGWGGGCCIVLVKDQEQAKKLMGVYKQNGFNSFQTKLGVEGVREIK